MAVLNNRWIKLQPHTMRVLMQLNAIGYVSPWGSVVLLYWLVLEAEMEEQKIRQFKDFSMKFLKNSPALISRNISTWQKLMHI